MSFSSPVKPKLWDDQYVIDNLPTWIYTDNKQPAGFDECRAKISSIEYTIKDIDLQIEVRELELKTGSSRHSNSFDYEKWKAQALRAKQTHMYLLNAYKYWLILNERSVSEEKLNYKLTSLIRLLMDEPEDFVTQLGNLL
jgi:hypothetical protein